MSYAQDVFARFGHELETIDTLLSEASAASVSPRRDLASANNAADDNDDRAQQDQHSKLVHIILSSLRPSDSSTTLPSVKQLLTLLENIHGPDANATTSAQGEELKILALARLVCATYAVAIDTLLQDAGKLDEESWYWTEIDESMRKTFAYLVQTLPSRLAKLTRETLELAAGSASHTLRSTLEVSTASIAKSVDKAALRKTLRNVRDTPNLITSMLFPYTFHLERSITLDSASTMRISERLRTSNVGATGIAKPKRQGIKSLRSTILYFTPQYLVRHEARCKRRGLFSERDRLAEKLGRLALRQEPAGASRLLEVGDSQNPKQAVLTQLNGRLRTLVECFSADENIELAASSSAVSTEATVSMLHTLLKTQLPKQQERIRIVLSPDVFGQPSGFTQRWPTLVFYPMGILLLTRYLSKNWSGIEAKFLEAKETVKSFLIGWVWEPCVQLLDTVRSGNEGTVIMSRDSLNSDLQSLERMVSDFTSDKYGVKGAELEAIAAKVREGDLTHVLKVYESEMKSPVKSMVSGSLIRALLIQIQKAKVDLEVAMSGIDKLLKSQQLLFGAVGIAPALGVVFVSQRYFRTKIANISSYRSQSMGQSYQIRAWEAMRRIDRLLSSPPAKADSRSAEFTHSPGTRERQDDEGRNALTQGLLLLDLSTLRSVSGPLLMSLAKGNKATSKRLQRHFLQDIRDIECGQTSAVERMWRSWGSALRATA